MFRQILENELNKRKMSIRAAAREIGISHSTLIAARDNTREIDMATALRITNWAGVPLVSLVEAVDPSGANDDRIHQAIKIAVDAVPGLKSVLIEAAEEMAKGRLSASDFRDIVEYATYKIRIRREQAEHVEEGATEQG